MRTTEGMSFKSSVILILHPPHWEGLQEAHILLIEVFVSLSLGTPPYWLRIPHAQGTQEHVSNHLGVSPNLPTTVTHHLPGLWVPWGQGLHLISVCLSTGEGIEECSWIDRQTKDLKTSSFLSFSLLPSPVFFLFWLKWCWIGQKSLFMFFGYILRKNLNGLLGQPSSFSLYMWYVKVSSLKTFKGSGQIEDKTKCQHFRN